MISTFSRVAVSAATALLAIAPVQAASPAVPPVTITPTVTSVRLVRMERHPELRRAIAALQSARVSMQRANHDFGGHRAEALAACDNAIAQLRIAEQYDR